jgi:hypothetical protein
MPNYYIIFPSKGGKANDGCEEWWKLYMIFSRSVRVSSHIEDIEHRALGNNIISDKHFNSCNTFRTIDIHRKFEYSEERTYQKKITDRSNIFGLLRLYRNSN